LNLRASLGVGVVATLERATVNKQWRKARLGGSFGGSFGGSYRGQDVAPESHTRNERRLNRRLFGFAFVDDFDDVMRGLGHEPHLGKLGKLGMGVFGRVATRMGTPEGTTQPACFGWRLTAWSV
jgi:hypothetical protein